MVIHSIRCIYLKIDLGSGSNVDVTVIEKDKVDVLRNYRKPNERGRKEKSYVFERGTTSKDNLSLGSHYLVILKENIRSFKDVTQKVDVMDITA